MPSAPSRISPTETSVSGLRARPLHHASRYSFMPVVIASVAVIDPAPLINEPAVDAGIPGMAVVALVLFGLGERNQLRLPVQPLCIVSAPQNSSAG
jgi:hypothetical protein